MHAHIHNYEHTYRPAHVHVCLHACLHAYTKHMHTSVHDGPEELSMMSICVFEAGAVDMTQVPVLLLVY